MRYQTKITETATQALGAAALAYSYEFLKDGYLDNIEFKFSGACSQTLTVTRDNLDGAAYDAVLKTQALGGATYFTYQPVRKIYFRKGDILLVGITSGGATTVGMTAFMEGGLTWVS